MRIERLGSTKRVLEATRTELLHRLTTSKDLEAERSADELEAAQVEADRDFAVRNLDNGTRCLREIDDALRRIEEGTYGGCVRCDGRIEERRLAVLPWGPLCLSCQQASERERADGSAAVTGTRSAPLAGYGSAELPGYCGPAPKIEPVEVADPPERVVTTLLVSQFEEDHAFLERFFARTKWKLHLSRTCQEGISLMRERRIAVVVTERELPDGSWESILAAAARCPASPKVITIYRFSEADRVGELLNAGAYDILARPLQENEVSQVISFAWLQWMRERRREGEVGNLAGKKPVTAVPDYRYRRASA